MSKIKIDNQDKHLTDSEVITLTEEVINNSKIKSTAEKSWQHILACNECLFEIQETICDYQAMEETKRFLESTEKKTSIGKSIKERGQDIKQSFFLALQKMGKGFSLLDTSLGHVALEPLSNYRSGETLSGTKKIESKPLKEVKAVVFFESFPILFKIGVKMNSRWSFHWEGLPGAIKSIELKKIQSDGSGQPSILGEVLVSQGQASMELPQSRLFPEQEEAVLIQIDINKKLQGIIKFKK